MEWVKASVFFVCFFLPQLIGQSHFHKFELSTKITCYKHIKHELGTLATVLGQLQASIYLTCSEPL